MFKDILIYILIMDYVNNFREALTVNDPELMYKSFATALNKENQLRELVVIEPTNKDVSSAVFSVYDNDDIFVRPKELSKYEQNVPVLSSRSEGTDNVIVDKDTFVSNFNIFSEFQLQLLNWDNLFVAGGATLAALMPVPVKYENQRRKYFHDVAYKDSDIDIFIYGLNEEEGTKKLVEVYNALTDFLPYEAICFRSTNAITIVSQYPHRNIQIILRLYSSKEEILMGFDVDCCSVGYDGTDVYITPRAHRALVTGRNTVDMLRRSPSYEYRLWKYSKRGYDIEVPQLDLSKVDPQIYEKRLSKSHGLTRLLLLFNIGRDEESKEYTNKLRKHRGRPEKRENTMFNERIGGYYLNKRSKEQLSIGADLSDYSAIFLPWGPGWKARDIAKIMLNKDYIMNSEEYDPNKKYPTHPCFMGTMEEVIVDCEMYTNEKYCFKSDGSKKVIDFEKIGMNETEIREYYDRYVIGDLRWKTLNPGEQRVGSFHPINDDEWIGSTYVSYDALSIHHAVVNGDCKTLEGLLKDVDSDTLNRKDPNGRTALHLAVIHGDIECMRLLMRSEIRLAYKMNDGRSAFHLACQYGNLQMVEELYEYGLEINKRELEKIEGDDHDEEKEDEDDIYSCVRKIIENNKKLREAKRLKNDENYKMEKALEQPDYFDPNEADWDNFMTPAVYAIVFNHLDILKFLYDKVRRRVFDRWEVRTDSYSYYSSDHRDVLNVAIKCGYIDIIKFMLDNGFYVTNEHVLKAVNSMNLDIIKMFVTSKNVNELFKPQNGEYVYILSYFFKKISKTDHETQMSIYRYLIECGSLTHYDFKHFSSSPLFAGIQYYGYSYNYKPTDRQKLRSKINQPLNFILNITNFELIDKFLQDNVGYNNWLFVNNNNNPLTILDFVNTLIANHKKKLADIDREPNPEPKLTFEDYAQAIIRSDGCSTQSGNRDIVIADITRYEAIRTLMIKHGCMTYSAMCEMNLIESYDEYLVVKDYESNDYAKKIPYSYKIAFRPLNGHPDRKNPFDGYVNEYNDQDGYMSFYEAVFNSDLDYVKNHPEIHVCSYCSCRRYFNVLHLAIMNNNFDMFTLLLDRAFEQFTPLKYSLTGVKNTDFVPNIKNSDLVGLENCVGKLSSDGIKGHHVLDADQDVDKVISSVNPVRLLECSNNSYTPLFEIIRSRRTNFFNYIVGKFSVEDLKFLFSDGTLFRSAIGYGMVGIADYILKNYGVPAKLKKFSGYSGMKNSLSINFYGKKSENVYANNYAVYEAIRYGQLESVKYLVDEAPRVWDEYDKKGVYVYPNDLNLSLDGKVLKYVIDNYAQIKSDNVYECLDHIFSKHPEMLMEKDYVDSACRSGLVKMTDFLLRNGAGFTWKNLESAVRNGKGELIEVVKRYVNIYEMRCPTTDKDVFMIAVASGWECVEEVFKESVDQVRDDVFGNTVLHYLCGYTGRHNVDKLIDRFSFHNRENCFGMTPYDYLIQTFKMETHLLDGNHIGSVKHCNKFRDVVNGKSRSVKKLLDINRAYMELQ